MDKIIDKAKETKPVELLNLDVYSHIKSNITQTAKNCTEPLSQSSFYCFTCMHSVCNECGLSDHSGHFLISRQKYLTYDKAFFPEVDQALTNAVSVDKTKEEMKAMVTSSVNSLHAKLEQIHKEKMAQIDQFYTDLTANLKEIKLHFDSAKESIEAYYKQNEPFFNESTNIDQENILFLMNFEMMNLCGNKNGDVLQSVRSIHNFVELHKATIEENTKEALRDIEHYLDFDYSFDKVDDFYWDVKTRAKKYNDHIQTFKKSIYDIVKTQGSFDRLNDLVEIFDSKNKRGIDLIFNQEYFLNKNIEDISVYKKMKIRGHCKGHSIASSKSGALLTTKSKQGASSTSPQKTLLNPFTHLQSDGDVTLDNRIVQRFFTYTLFDIYGKLFAQTKEKNHYTSEYYMRSYTERSNKLKEYAKPILGTNEIALFNNQTNLINRVSVKLDKDVHGYAAFPHGSRHILIDHHLYITGGVDQLKNRLTEVLCFDIRENTIERLNPLLSPHSYHAIEYLDNYDCLIVIGGETSTACEIFDLFTGNWTKLPDLNFPRANVNIYYDNITSDIYALFGMDNLMTETKSYSNIIEVLEMKDIVSGWFKVDYYKSADLNLKINFCTVLPFSRDTLQIYGGNSARSQKKLFALFHMNKNEVLKIDERTMEEMKVEEKRMRNMDLALEKIK